MNMKANIHFQSPRYMKGRMTPDKVNIVVDALNQACAAKYEILRTPKSKQSDKIRTAIREYRDQETKETEGECLSSS